MVACTSVALTVTWAGLTLLACQSGPTLSANQKRGKRIYEGLCDKCHKLIEPKKFDDNTWKAATVKYGTQLKLSASEIESVTDYLTRANDETK